MTKLSTRMTGPPRGRNFHARLSRYRSLLLEKWWVLVLGALVGAGIEGATGVVRPAELSSPSDG